MLIRAIPIVDTPLSPRVQQPDIQKVYRSNKKLRFCSSRSTCFHQSASRPRLLLEVLFYASTNQKTNRKKFFCTLQGRDMNEGKKQNTTLSLPINIQSDSSSSKLEVSK